MSDKESSYAKALEDYYHVRVTELAQVFTLTNLTNLGPSPKLISLNKLWPILANSRLIILGSNSTLRGLLSQICDKTG